MAVSTTHPAAGFVSPALSSRGIALLAILALHALFIYLLASGLGSSMVRVLLPETKAIVLPDKQIEPERPAPQPIENFVPPKVDLVKPDVTITDTETVDTSNMITPDPPVEQTPVTVNVTPALPPIRLIGKHQIPNADSYYPPSEIRAGVEGSTDVHVCADTRGKPEGTPTVARGSGSAKLDAAAVSMARDGRYARAMRGDELVPNCYDFRIVFKIRS